MSPIYQFLDCFFCNYIGFIQHSTAIFSPLGLLYGGRLPLKCDGTRAETRFRLSAKRTSPFKSAGASVQSITGSRGVRISGSNVVYGMFRGSVKSTGYPLHSPVSPSLPPPAGHRVPSHFKWTLKPVTFSLPHSNDRVSDCCILKI